MKAHVDEYPEHEKLRAISDQSQTVGEFVEWMGQQGIHLGEYLHGEWSQARLVPTHRNTVDLLAEFFGIDQKRLEGEKRAMLASLQATQ